MAGSAVAIAVDVVAALRARGESVGTAESLTGGLVCASLTSVPGASSAVRGSVVAYAVALKHELLGVDSDILEGVGAVSRDCAEAMAVGGARRTGAQWCVATTGVAGPEPSEGKPVGTVHLAVATQEHVIAHRALHLHGDREQIRAQTVVAALELLRDALSVDPSAPRGTVGAEHMSGDPTKEG